MSEKKTNLHITEVTAEDSISVTALMENKKIELPAKYVSLSDEQLAELEQYGKNILPIESIVQEKEKELYIVSFAGHVSVLAVVIITPEGVFKFDHVQIKKHEFADGKIIHVIVAVVPEGNRYNRRRGIRINLDTTMTLEQGEDKILVLVKDLSYCGLSFVNLTAAEFDEKQTFLIHLMEKEGDKSYLIGKIITKVHRVHEHKDGTIVYGCIVAEKHANFLQRYIALKQMEAISGKKSFNNIQKTSNNKDTWRADVATALGDLITEEQLAEEK